MASDKKESWPEVDELQLFFGEDCQINEKIIVKQPTIIDIVRYGERKYFGMVSTLCAVPSDMKSVLWDIGIDWNKFSDFELFILLSHNYSQEDTSIIFGDLDLTQLKAVNYQPNPEVDADLALVDEENDILLTRTDYTMIVTYLRKMHGITVKREKAGNKFTRDILLEEDRKNIAMNKGKPYHSQLLPLVSSMMAYPGFSYTKEQLKQCGIYEFMDTVKRSQIFVSTTTLLTGLQVGMRDSKNIKSDDLNWLRDIK